LAAGRGEIPRTSFGHDGHNLMRYRPDAVASAILSVDRVADNQRPEL
jgi:hypothetical protein